MDRFNKRQPGRNTRFAGLEGSAHRPVPGAGRIANADPRERLTVTIVLRRRVDHAPVPDQAHWSQTPPRRRTFISRSAFAATRGSHPADVAQIRKFAQRHRLKIVDTRASSRTMVLSGTVEQFNAAFGVDLGLYVSPNQVGDGSYSSQMYRGHDGPVMLPKALSGIVRGVFGLDNRRMWNRQVSGAPSGAGSLTPPQVASLYDFPVTAGAGAGQTIGIIEFGGGIRTNRRGQFIDFRTYFQGLGLAVPSVSVVMVDGATNNPYSPATQEVTLDVCVAGAIAPGARIVVYFAPNSTQGTIDAITTALHDAVHAPSVLSISWSAREFDPDNTPAWTASTLEALSEIYAEGAALGVTILASSGDDGSNCQVGDGRPHVAYPASDPWVTGCGGTTITNVNGASFNENTWNDKVWTGAPWLPYSGGATGGGYSQVFAQPAWQQTRSRKPSTRRRFRGVPDIAGNASDYSGYRLPWSGVTIGPIAGTSAVAPLYAGLFALVNESLGTNLGYLNPTLYALRQSHPAVFRDINDSASNSVPFDDFTATPPAVANSPGYSSQAGWDPCTGLGVLNGSAFLTAVSGL